MLVLPKYNDVRLIALNRTAKLIYDLCDGKNNIEQICAEVASVYNDIDKQTIIEDLILCLRSFEHKGLITLKRTISDRIC